MLNELRTSGLQQSDWIRASDEFRAMFKEGTLPKEPTLKLFERVGRYEIAEQVRAWKDGDRQATIADVLHTPRVSGSAHNYGQREASILLINSPACTRSVWSLRIRPRRVVIASCCGGVRSQQSRP